MSLKDQWNNTGKEWNDAMKDLGKNIARTVSAGVDKADEALNGKEQDPTEEQPSVFSDGSWRKTGKKLGDAVESLGKSIVKSAKTGVDYVEKNVKR